MLTGAVFGVALSFVALGNARILPLFGYPAQYPTYGIAVDVLAGPGRLVAIWIGASIDALEGALVTVLVFVVLRLLLRRTWLTVAAGVVLMSLVSVEPDWVAPARRWSGCSRWSAARSSRSWSCVSVCSRARSTLYVSASS